MAKDRGQIRIESAAGSRLVSVADCLGSDEIERAESEANAWIKRLRAIPVEGLPLRDRFTFRGDSLWWFAELYLHKRRVVASVFRTLFALDALLARERPTALGVASGDCVLAHVAREVARREGLRWTDSAVSARPPVWTRAEPHVRGHFYALSALADRMRPGHRAPDHAGPVRIAAFVHSAFWRPTTHDESYIGSVLAEIAARSGREGLHLVGLGPRTNFRVRSWRHRLSEFGDPQASALPFAPVEVYAPRGVLAPSLALWRERRALRRAVLDSPALRCACVIAGCDVWPLLRPEWEGICYLQFPWSARAMDEAGAALDALRPSAVVTYAEAGGWGRALVLEARRRGIPVVGLQHGFIYRHWLNYLHEPDEMQPSQANDLDAGFPFPDLTLVYDQFTANHLVEAGRFPADRVMVTGSPKLDAFVRTAAALDEAARRSIRASVGCSTGQHLVVVATKYSQIAGAIRPLVESVAGMPDARLVVKCHPAESPEPYLRAAAGAANVTIAPAGADLARLVAAASALVTVNSTAAIEAMPIGVPALVVSLPNNLSPFVEAGAMAGAYAPEEIGRVLRSLLYDQEFRSRLAAGREAFMARFAVRADGGAARRAADAILRLAGIPFPKG